MAEHQHSRDTLPGPATPTPIPGASDPDLPQGPVAEPGATINGTNFIDTRLEKIREHEVQRWRSAVSDFFDWRQERYETLPPVAFFTDRERPWRELTPEERAAATRAAI